MGSVDCLIHLLPQTRQDFLRSTRTEYPGAAERLPIVVPTRIGQCVPPARWLLSAMEHYTERVDFADCGTGLGPTRLTRALKAEWRLIGSKRTAKGFTFSTQ